jgi:hypothetical protein
VAEADWIARIEAKGTWAPIWLACSIVTGYLLIRCAVDGIFLATLGLPDGVDPFWRSDLWWAEVVNAVLMGYVPAVLVIARRGIGRDFDQLRPRLPSGEADAIRRVATRRAGLVGRAVCLGGFAAGIAIVVWEPSVTGGAEQSLTNPAFMWPLLHTPVFIWLVVMLFVSDINATRTYRNVGRNLIEVDLLDIQSLSPFARRGLRSALTWIVFSMIFSLFWVGDETAARGNGLLFVTVLAMAIGAFVAPLSGVHNNIVSVKRLELDRLRDQIRVVRGAVLDKSSDADPTSPRLANLIAYHQLIDGAREWPIDAANLLRFFMYLIIGLGSWLGGAVVERLLDRTLSG